MATMVLGHEGLTGGIDDPEIISAVNQPEYEELPGAFGPDHHQRGLATAIGNLSLESNMSQEVEVKQESLLWLYPLKDSSFSNPNSYFGISRPDLDIRYQPQKPLAYIALNVSVNEIPARIEYHAQEVSVADPEFIAKAVQKATEGRPELEEAFVVVTHAFAEPEKPARHLRAVESAGEPSTSAHSSVILPHRGKAAA